MLYWGRRKYSSLDHSYSCLTTEKTVAYSLETRAVSLCVNCFSCPSSCTFQGPNSGRQACRVPSPAKPSCQPPPDVCFGWALAAAVPCTVHALPLYIFSIKLPTFSPFSATILYLVSVKIVSHWNWLLSYRGKMIKCCFMAKYGMVKI